MDYFEKLFMGNAFPLEEIRYVFTATEHGRELVGLLNKTSKTLKDGLTEK